MLQTVGTACHMRGLTADIQMVHLRSSHSNHNNKCIRKCCRMPKCSKYHSNRCSSSGNNRCRCSKHRRSNFSSSKCKETPTGSNQCGVTHRQIIRDTGGTPICTTEGTLKRPRYRVVATMRGRVPPVVVAAAPPPKGRIRIVVDRPPSRGGH